VRGRLVLVVVVGLAAGWALGCSGLDPGLGGSGEPAAVAGSDPSELAPPAPVFEGTENRDACRAYIQAFNALSCLPAEARLDAEAVCPAELDVRGCDQTRYWSCMQKMIRCEGSLPVPGDSATCSPVCG
jgi:hypothetical protein